jgi:hypothetical protein
MGGFAVHVHELSALQGSLVGLKKHLTVSRCMDLPYILMQKQEGTLLPGEWQKNSSISLLKR